MKGFPTKNSWKIRGNGRIRRVRTLKPFNSEGRQPLRGSRRRHRTRKPLGAETAPMLLAFRAPAVASWAIGTDTGGGTAGERGYRDPTGVGVGHN